MPLLNVLAVPSLIALVVIGFVQLRNQFAGSRKTNL